MSQTVAPRSSRTRAYRWLAALPALCMLGGVPMANRVEPYVLGLPFLLFWIVLWVVLTSGVMALVYALDAAADRSPATPAAGGDVARRAAGADAEDGR